MCEDASGHGHHLGIEQDITPLWACCGSGMEVDEYLALCCIHPFPTSLQFLLVMASISNIIRNIVIFWQKILLLIKFLN